jgi:hypothetical protein
LYRATRDGFSASSFHRKCAGITNTISKNKTDSNYVLGGFTSITWNSTEENSYWSPDNTAFLFSLRRSGVSNNEKFNLDFDYWRSYYAVYESPNTGPCVGGGYDIQIYDNSNFRPYSSSYFCISYECPST